ncbi:MAG: hypothetical protein GEEBNDBF_01823 [bacterium]|nr:hypothetical protein [bacterium]
MRPFALLAACAIFLLTGCPGGGTTDPPPARPRVLSVSPAGLVGKAGATVQFAAAVEGSVESYAWEFTGATPGTSSAATPEVQLTADGDYTGSLQVAGPTGISDAFSFTYSVGETGAPVWERFPVQAAGMDAATNVRAGLFDNHLVVVYSTAQPSLLPTLEVFVAVSSLARPEHPADWTSYKLSAAAHLGLNTSMISLHGRPALEYQNRDYSPGIDTRRILWANTPNPQSPGDWQTFRVFDPADTPQQPNMLWYKSIIPLSNGGLGVAAHSLTTKRAYWISTTTLPPTSDADWSYIELSLNVNEDYAMAELDGGLSLAYGSSGFWGGVSWRHAPTLSPASAAEFQIVTSSNGISGKESEEVIQGFTVLPDRALLITTFGTSRFAPGLHSARHQVIARSFPILPPAPPTIFDAFVTGPSEEYWDPGFFERSILWDGRLLGHLYLRDEIFLLRALTPTPTSAEDFESYGLVANLPYFIGGGVRSLAMTPLADGGAAVLTCARPDDPPQPLEIWYPSGPW